MDAVETSVESDYMDSDRLNNVLEKFLLVSVGTRKDVPVYASKNNETFKNDWLYLLYKTTVPELNCCTLVVVREKNDCVNLPDVMISTRNFATFLRCIWPKSGSDESLANVASYIDHLTTLAPSPETRRNMNVQVIGMPNVTGKGYSYITLGVLLGNFGRFYANIVEPKLESGTASSEFRDDLHRNLKKLRTGLRSRVYEDLQNRSSAHLRQYETYRWFSNGDMHGGIRDQRLREIRERKRQENQQRPRRLTLKLKRRWQRRSGHLASSSELMKNAAKILVDLKNGGNWPSIQSSPDVIVSESNSPQSVSNQERAPVSSPA